MYEYPAWFTMLTINISSNLIPYMVITVLLVNLKRRRENEDIQKLRNFKHKAKHKIGCYPKSLLIFTSYQVQWWWNIIIIPVKYQPDCSNVRSVLPKISWHTHLKYSKTYIFILQKVKKPLDLFCTHLFFASAIIIIFSRLCLHILSRLHKFKLNWSRVITTEFARQKFRTRRENPNSIKLVCKARNNRPKGHTKNSFLQNFKGYDMPHTLFKIVILRTSWILLWWVISQSW